MLIGMADAELSKIAAAQLLHHVTRAAAMAAADDTLPLEVRRSAVHGDGAFATRGLARGRQVGVYAGRRYAPGELLDQLWDNALTYLFGLSDGHCIDGRDGGNATRHINHSCAPNCAAVEVTAEDGTLEVANRGESRRLA